MTEELHLFIIWQNAQYKLNDILADIDAKFDIMEVYKIHWQEAYFSENLTRFYGVNLPPDSKKEIHCGRGPFILIIVRDRSPAYEYRLTSKGKQKVNIRTFDAKTIYRSWTGGGHRIHSTNSQEEFDHDITLLFGRNIQDMTKQLPQKWDGKIKDIHSNIVGNKGWDSIGQLFYVLNSTVRYVVLRNFEKLPDRYSSDNHKDIDLLTDDPEQLRFITNAKRVFKDKNRVLHSVIIGGKEVLFDFRFVGDGYYDSRWENAILKRRIFYSKGFFIPAEEDYFYTLLYHALIHKPTISTDYIERLTLFASKLDIDVNTESFEDKDHLRKILDAYMNANNYRYDPPQDFSVFYSKQRFFRLYHLFLAAKSKVLG